MEHKKIVGDENIIELQRCGKCDSPKLQIEAIYNDTVYIVCKMCGTGFFSDK